jgi:hypothetical protein
MAWIQRLSFLTSSKGVENLRALRAPADGISAAAGGCAAERWPWIESLSPVGPPGREARGGPCATLHLRPQKRTSSSPARMAWIQRLIHLGGSKGVENLRPLRASTDGVSAAVGSDRPKSLAVGEIPRPVGPPWRQGKGRYLPSVDLRVSKGLSRAGTELDDECNLLTGAASRGLPRSRSPGRVSQESGPQTLYPCGANHPFRRPQGDLSSRPIFVRRGAYNRSSARYLTLRALGPPASAR